MIFIKSKNIKTGMTTDIDFTWILLWIWPKLCIMDSYCDN